MRSDPRSGKVFRTIALLGWLLVAIPMSASASGTQPPCISSPLETLVQAVTRGEGGYRVILQQDGEMLWARATREGIESEFPVVPGVRLAVRDRNSGLWVPAQVEQVKLGSRRGPRVTIRKFAAGKSPKGERMEIESLSDTEFSADFLGAEKAQLDLAQQTARNGRAATYRETLVLPTDRGPQTLERGTMAQLDLSGAGAPVPVEVVSIDPVKKRIRLKPQTNESQGGAQSPVELAWDDLRLRKVEVTKSPEMRQSPQTGFERWKERAATPVNWIQAQASNLHGAYHVLDMIAFNPMRGGLLSKTHPWVTGISPKTGKPIWPDNVIFKTVPDPKKAHKAVLESDEQILNRVGTFLASMVDKPATQLKHPFGLTNRMPIAVNYIHGSVHYNSGLILFNDFAEGVHHLTDPRFIEEIRRFTRDTQREILFVFRNQDFSADEYAHFIGTVRAHLPWFANPNGIVRKGAKDGDKYVFEKKVLWGAPSAYPVVNPINGNWIRDMRMLEASEKNPEELLKIVRDPIEKGRYFQEQFQGVRDEPIEAEKFIADLIDRQIRKRPEGRGNLAFTDQRELTREKLLADGRKIPAIDLAPKTEVEALVIGSGPAGLEIAQRLRKNGINVLVAEKEASVGSSWRNLPTNYRLRSPKKELFLSDTPKEIHPKDRWLTGDRYADYLIDYAMYHRMPVATGTEIVSVEKLADNRFRAVTQDGKEIFAKSIVDGRGTRPGSIPTYPGMAESQIPQLHAAEYSDPQQVSELLGGRDKKVLIVGANDLAGEVLNELEKTGFKVDLSSQGLKADDPKSLQKLDPPMQKGRTGEVLLGGRAGIRDDIERMEGDTVVFKDGGREKYDLVIHAPKPEPIANLGKFDEGYHPHGKGSGGDHASPEIKAIRGDSEKLAREIEKEVRAEPVPEHVVAPKLGGAKPVPVRDISDLVCGKRVKVAGPLQQSDVIMAFAPKCGHVSLFAGGKEFHGRLIFNRIKMSDRSRTIMGGVLIRFPEVTAEQRQAIIEAMKSMKGRRTLTCLKGACDALAAGDIVMKDQASLLRVSGVEGFDAILRDGFVNASGERVEVDLFKANTDNLAEMRKYLAKADRHYSPYGPLMRQVERAKSGARRALTRAGNAMGLGLLVFTRPDGQTEMVVGEWPEEAGAE